MVIRQNSRRTTPFVSGLLVLSAVICAVSAPEALAQDASPRAEEISRSRIPTFEGEALSERDLEREPLDVASGLKAVAIKEIYEALGAGDIYFKLTPSSPKNDAGALVFVNADIVEGGEGYALWVTEGSITAPFHSDGGVAVWFWSEAARLYLIDCEVYGLSGRVGWLRRQPITFRVDGPSDSQTFEHPPREKVHLFFIVEAENAGWYGLWISALTNHTAAKLRWKMYSCQASIL